MGYMTVTAWKSGKHRESGGGYGLKVAVDDRDEYFKREWKYIVLELEGSSILVKPNVDKPSFWNEICHELIDQGIGKWLISNGLAPWPKQHPPKLRMEQVFENRFFVHKKNLRGVTK